MIINVKLLKGEDLKVIQINYSKLTSTSTYSTKAINKLKTTERRSTTAVYPRHLKVKEQDISLTKNYCITISIKIISSIHIFILRIQQVLGSDELKSQCRF